MFVIIGGLFLVLATLDMGIKQYIEDTFQKNEERETVVPKIVLRKVYNKGLFLNSLDQYPAFIKAESAAAGICVLLYDVWVFLHKGNLCKKIGMAFVSAGALSNIYDRLIRGKVIDYIGVRCKNKFLLRVTANLADLYVVLGAFLVAIAKCFRK